MNGRESNEPRRLRCFLAAADELSFRRAAEVIGVGRPVISRQVAALEDEFGVALFECKTTGARLTEAGRAFLADTPLDRRRDNGGGLHPRGTSWAGT